MTIISGRFFGSVMSFGLEPSWVYRGLKRPINIQEFERESGPSSARTSAEDEQDRQLHGMRILSTAPPRPISGIGMKLPIPLVSTSAYFVIIDGAGPNGTALDS